MQLHDRRASADWPRDGVERQMVGCFGCFRGVGVQLRDRRAGKPKELDNWTYKARNAVLFNVDEVPLTMEEHLQRQKMNQRIINKQATRFSQQTHMEPRQSSMARVAMLQAVNQPGKVDISGQEVGVIKASTLDLVVTPSPAPGHRNPSVVAELPYNPVIFISCLSTPDEVCKKFPTREGGGRGFGRFARQVCNFMIGAQVPIGHVTESSGKWWGVLVASEGSECNFVIDVQQMSSPSENHLTTFDLADEHAKLPVVPKSVNSGKQMSSPSENHLTTFDLADEHAKLPVVPKSVNSGKVVKLGVKKLRTEKEVRTILPEEDYLEKLQNIIVRDYFPELPRLKAQKEYLDAVAANDLSKIRELQLRYSTKRTERRTSPSARRRSPDVFDAETPGPSRETDVVPDSERSDVCNRMGDNEAGKEKKLEDKLTVDSYLNKYTSEDNASFEELAALHAKKERVRNAWMYAAEKKHNEELVMRGDEPIKAADEQLMIAAAPGASDVMFRKTPGFGSARSTERLLLMSPAARRLATKGLGIRLNSDKALKASCSSSPAWIARTGVRTPSSSVILRKTPSRTEAEASPLVTNVSITDNLLDFADTAPAQKKSRPSAADFF
ncbi:ES2 similar protein 2 [Toxocara canis]|uniref:ES2 similar protein 2 n=1 Tax=Toxocara canis TaxID=6265 RepID=A0A0B2VYA4_TOXCA|nr:ES2 similar protein 2 [Toxocara canis]